MLYLVLAVCASSMISVFMRIGTHRVNSKLSMLAVNYLVCMLLASVYTVRTPVSGTQGLGITVIFGAMAGVLYLAGFVLLQRSIRQNGMVLSSVFMKLGLLVPIVLSLTVFHETPTWVQLVGFILALVSICMINLPGNTQAKGLTMSLLVLLLVGGGADAMSKVFEAWGPAQRSEQFLLITFLVAFMLCTALVLLRRERPGWKEVGYGLLVGIPNFFSAKFLLLALNRLDAVVVYPTFSVATGLIVTLVGVTLFRERLKPLQWLALVGVLAALLLLNL